MNKFILPPDNLASLLGCVFWIFAFAGAVALAFAAVLAIAR